MRLHMSAPARAVAIHTQAPLPLRWCVGASVGVRGCQEYGRGAGNRHRTVTQHYTITPFLLPTAG